MEHVLAREARRAQRRSLSIRSSAPISVLISFLALVSDCQAQSLWPYRAPERVNLIADTAARRVGDLITIFINENTDVENSDNRNLDKDSEAGFRFDFSSSSAAPANLDIAGDSNRSFNGQSNYSVEQEFTDRLTVEVLDVLPNGNLVIGGKRERMVAGEHRTLVITGIVRSIDLSPNNTISSQYVANFKICYAGKGPESAFSNQGWAGRALNRLWPF